MSAEPRLDGDLEHADDRVLVQRARAGESRAFDALMRRHDGVLRRAALRVTRNAADADDVRQETALKVWQNLHSLDDATKARAWILRIAVREALRLLAGRRQEHELTDDAALVSGPDGDVERFDLQRTLQTVLDGLPSRQAQAWLLRELGGLSYRAIADQLEIPESSVRGALVLARRRIQAAVHEMCPAARATVSSLGVAAPVAVPDKSSVAVYPAVPVVRPAAAIVSPLHEGAEAVLAPVRTMRGPAVP